jgi:hypothetical protein
MLFSPKLYANAGIPMIVIIWPIFWLSFIPIVFLEVYVLRKFFKETALKSIMYFTFLANFISTLVGIPIVWINLVLVEFGFGGGPTHSHFPPFLRYLCGVTLQAPWLMPYESQLYWMIPVAFMFLLVPFFFVSVVIERLIIERFVTYNVLLIKTAVIKANIISYAFLFLLCFCYLIHGFYKKIG